ncbi:hypothetical protein APTCPA18_CDS89 [Pseudomonas phage APTC-PA18]|nr:hypothetical protein APTCPA18_CDS89 [Pseudomonas phage APTC-PA18]
MLAKSTSSRRTVAVCASAGCISARLTAIYPTWESPARSVRRNARVLSRNTATPFSNVQAFQNRGTVMKLYHAKVSPPSFYRHNQTDEERKALEAEYVSKLHVLLGNLEGVTIGNPGERNWDPSTWSNDVPVVCNEIGLGRLTASAWDLDKDYPYTIISLVLLWDDIDPEAALRPMLERLELAASRLAGRSEGYISQPQMVHGVEGWNSLTGSAIPGPNLQSVNRLLLKEDCCTDELQYALDAGWRLLAVCPQEARRPDYILGRFDPVPPTGPRGASRSID